MTNQEVTAPLHKRHIAPREVMGAIVLGTLIGLITYAGGAELLSQHPEIILKLAELPGCGLIGSGDRGDTYMGTMCSIGEKSRILFGFTKHADGSTAPIGIQFFENIFSH